MTEEIIPKQIQLCKPKDCVTEEEFEKIKDWMTEEEFEKMEWVCEIGTGKIPYTMKWRRTGRKDDYAPDRP